jgi:hypothetical protein
MLSATPHISHVLCTTQRTYIYRVQSSVWRVPNYRPPTPLSSQRVCPPPAPKAGGTHSPGGEEVGGSIVRKTPDIGLASDSIISLRCTVQVPTVHTYLHMANTYVMYQHYHFEYKH